MRMQVILDSSFARLGSAPIWGGKKGKFRDWTSAPSDDDDLAQHGGHAANTKSCSLGLQHISLILDMHILFN